MKTSDRNGQVVGAHTVHENEALMMITANGQTIRIPVDGLRTISRNTQGVCLINLDEGDKLVSATPVEVDEDAVVADGVDAVEPATEPEPPAEGLAE